MLETPALTPPRIEAARNRLAWVGKARTSRMYVAMTPIGGWSLSRAFIQHRGCKSAVWGLARRQSSIDGMTRVKPCGPPG